MSSAVEKCVRLMMQARDGKSFFQVIFVRANTFDDARMRAQAYLAREGASFIEFDEDETAMIDVKDIAADSMFASASPEGVIAASGRIYVLPR